MTPSEWLVIGERIGLVSFMFLGYVGLVRGWWVPGFVYRDMVSDRDKWQVAEDRQSKINGKLVEIVDVDA